MPPTALMESLRSVRRRAKAWSLALGIGLSIAIAAALLLVTVLVDYLLNLPAKPRLVLIAAALATLVVAVWRWLIRPACSRLSLSDVASHLEAAFPQFDDRLRSTVDFLSHDVPGSDAMKQVVVAEAATLARDVDLGSALVRRPVLFSLAGAVLALSALAAIGTLGGRQFVDIAISRILNPLGGAAWPKRVRIDMIGQVPRRVANGQRLDLRMRLGHGDRPSLKAIAYYRYGDGQLRQEYMTRSPDGVYSLSLDARTSAADATAPLNVSIQSGDDQRDLPTITVVPRLAITSVEARVQAPAYAAADAPAIYNLTQVPAVMTAGSRVTLQVHFNKPLDPAQPPVFDMQSESAGSATPPATAPAGPSGDAAAAATTAATPARAVDSVTWRLVAGGAQATFVATQSRRFRIVATDLDGFHNAALEDYELIVRPDQMPLVQIEYPRRNEERTAQSLVPLQAIAEDDFGIRSLTLVVDRVADKAHWEIPLVQDAQAVRDVTWTRADTVSADRKRYHAAMQWELGGPPAPRIQPGDLLEYSLLVQDNYLLDGRTHPPVASGKLRITVISQEELADRIAGELRMIAMELNELLSTQVRTHEQTATLAQDTADKPLWDTADRAMADRLAGQQSTVAGQTRQIAVKLRDVAGRLEENRSTNPDLQRLARDVADQLTHTAESPMKDAATQIGAARDRKVDPQDADAAKQQAARDRRAQLASAQEKQDQASEQVRQAVDRLGGAGSLRQALDRISGLLRKQQDLTARSSAFARDNLGKTTEQLKPEQRAALDELVKQQRDLSAASDRAIADLDKLSQQLSTSDPTSADAMKKSAQTGRGQQVPANQSRAADLASRNQQAQAQSAQRQSELGLQLMLNDLREAENRKLAELSRQLAKIQEQIARLIQRQAGHNLDNLSIQGPEAAGALAPEQLAALRDQANRPADAPQPTTLPTVPQLTGSQEQTDRNTRDISTDLDKVQDGAAAASHLTRAADRMDRAIIALRAAKLADAFQPPQVDALDELLAAQRIVDQQKARLDAEQNQRQRDSIRQVYEQIRADQDTLNTQTAQIHGRRDPNGALERIDLIRLGQLPGEQGKLADRIGELDPRLSALGSVVYVWANHDVQQAMQQVKDEIGRQQTGPSVQSQQARVIQLLDAIIRNLAIQPKQSQFAQGHGGGGGGSGAAAAPRLPPEVELRLLKDLQIGVNQSTHDAAATPQPDRQQVADLGTRQGELRNLLDQLLQKASHGQVKLGPEPDNRDQLPEEASDQDIEDQEMDRSLLNDAPTADAIDKNVNRVGDRMARARQRLAINNDPGPVTQRIQKRIVDNLDDLIRMAQNQAQQQSSSSQQQGQAQNQQPQPRPGQNGQQPANQGAQANAANSPAQASVLRPGATPNAQSSGRIEGRGDQWGDLPPHIRAAVVEGQGEHVVPKYRKLVEDYYRSLATKASDH